MRFLVIFFSLFESCYFQEVYFWVVRYRLEAENKPSKQDDNEHKDPKMNRFLMTLQPFNNPHAKLSKRGPYVIKGLESH